MAEEQEEQKQKIFNTIYICHTNETPKKKYFRIEKEKRYNSNSNEAHSKAIFTTKKDYNFLRRKTLREIEIPKINKNNNKFITTTIDDTTTSAQSENSFLVKNIIPRKLKITKENKKIKNNFSEYIDDKNNWQNCRIKLMIVYFNSIKNLCKYINKNFFDIDEKENKIIDTFLNQVYQTFRILNRKINEFKVFQYMKEIFKSKIKEEDFVDILTLKQNLEFMKNVLNKKMSENLIIIYINIENFCKDFSPLI